MFIYKNKVYETEIEVCEAIDKFVKDYVNNRLAQTYGEFSVGKLKLTAGEYFERYHRKAYYKLLRSCTEQYVSDLTITEYEPLTKSNVNH